LQDEREGRKIKAQIRLDTMRDVYEFVIIASA
jgi:hypothetical protein